MRKNVYKIHTEGMIVYRYKTHKQTDIEHF